MNLVRASASRLVVLLAAAILFALAAPDRARAAEPGVVSSEYRLPAKVDPEVAQGVVTEIWARVYRPQTLTAAPFPLLVFLHGNHATCGRFVSSLGIRIDDDTTYTFEGRCPSGYVVTPNHLGYAYLAEQLAKAGYVVVSINANRGVNAAGGVSGDFGLNLRRGRLVLKHLELLAQWNRAGGAPASLGFDVRGKLDFAQVGLMGHSRGGEGMRAALAQLRDAGSPWPGRIGEDLRVRGLYEIGPVDGQTERTLDALGVAWNVLLPYCDGDVSSLEGVQPFDRMLLKTKDPGRLPKSTFAVYGANHNFYNTEWQQSDSQGCVGHQALFPELRGSAQQRATASGSLVPFFRAHVGDGASPAQAGLFDPLRPLPAAVAGITRVDRGYTDTPDRSIELRIEDFERDTGTSSYGVANLAQGIEIDHVRPIDHADVQRAAAIEWTSPAASRFFQTNWTAPGSGRDVSAYRTLEFRASRQCDSSCSGPAPLNREASTDLSVRLVRADGSLSTAVRLAPHLVLRGPVGVGDEFFGFVHPILATARIPLAAFGLGPSSPVRGVRFVFDRTASGAVYLANVRLSKRAGPAGAAAVAVAGGSEAGRDAGGGTGVPGRSGAPAAKAAITAIRRVASVAERGGDGGTVVEVEIAADQPLPVTDALPTLTVGDRRFRLSRFAGGRTDRIVFTLDQADLAAVPDEAPVELSLGVRQRFDLGRLRKSDLR